MRVAAVGRNSAKNSTTKDPIGKTPPARARGVLLSGLPNRGPKDSYGETLRRKGYAKIFVNVPLRYFASLRLCC